MSAEIPVIADGLSDAMSRYRYTCYACAIMPDHVHLVIRKHKDKAEEIIANVQEAVRLRLGNLPLTFDYWAFLVGPPAAD